MADWSTGDDARGDPGYRRPRVHVTYDGRPRSDDDVGADGDSVPHRGTDPDPARHSYSHVASQVSARADVDAVLQSAVVVHRRSGVDDAPAAEHRQRIDYGPSQHHAPRADPYGGTHYRGRMHDRHHVETLRREFRLLGEARAIMPDRDHYRVMLRRRGQDVSAVTDDGPGTGFPESRPSVVVEDDGLAAVQDRRFRNDTPMPAGAENREAVQSLLPVNLGMVASPGAEMPWR